VPAGDPADVAALHRPQQPGGAFPAALAEKGLDAGHRLQQGSLLAVGQGLEQRLDIGFAAPIERCKGALAGRGDREMEVARVVGRALAADELLVLELPQQAAEVAGVEVEIAREFGRRRPFAMSELPEQARFGQREARVGQAFVQDADAPRVEAVEAADRFGARGRVGRGGHGVSDLSGPEDAVIVSLIIASGN
jgi:hypothetical protein